MRIQLLSQQNAPAWILAVSWRCLGHVHGNVLHGKDERRPTPVALPPMHESELDKGGAGAPAKNLETLRRYLSSSLNWMSP